VVRAPSSVVLSGNSLLSPLYRPRARGVVSVTRDRSSRSCAGGQCGRRETP
jgi:hypothetical protein